MEILKEDDEMNIEEAIDMLENNIADYIIGEYCEKCADNKICNDRNEDCYYQQAIDTVVTAYEKEKEKNKKINEYVKQCDWHDNDVYIGEDILDILEKE